MNFQPVFLAEVAERRATLRTTLATLFPTPQAIVWEVGCGHGHFLVRYALEFPQKFCVGIDMILDRLQRSGKKRDRSRLTNCHFVRAEAREFFHALPSGVTFAEIWVLFPDPWPKARHHKNRILKEDFFAAAATRAGEGARFYFRTDHEQYFQSVFAIVSKLTTWQLLPDAPWPLEHETVFQARAPRFQSLVAVRTASPAPAAILVGPGQPPPTAPTSSA
ncbi:MAG: methyltransferase domain-containing protein [Candidatus Didemnitutus sp.]|nr:methyltransferase domain-containing protein [Candidatus Didemnitutus sp.]